MRQSQKGYTTLKLSLVAVFLLMLGGWVSNIVQIANSSFDPLTAIVVLRCIGVFIAPLGVGLGYV